MSQDEKLKDILEKLPKSERAAVLTHRLALKHAAEKYQNSPSAASLKNWETTKAAFEKIIAELSQPAPPDRFKNKLAAFRWLAESGAKIAKTKFYDDAKSGRIEVAPDGSISYAALDAYRRVYLEQAARPSAALSDLQTEKLIAELELKRIQIESDRLKLEKERDKYVLKADLEMEIAARAAILQSELHHAARTRAADLIELVDGDEGRAEQFVSALVDVINAGLTGYADTRSRQVIFEGNEEAENG